MVPYQYQPLDEKAHNIRLMTLLPGNFSSEVRVLLTITPFEKDHPPVFDALSYVWGDSSTPKNIFIGTSGDTTLAVTSNLSQALPYLRYKKQERILWIDAICVDQQNLKERGQQVARMGDIFTLADKVIVWLGPEDKEVIRGLKVLRQLSSHIEVDWATYNAKHTATVHAIWASLTGKLFFGGHTVNAMTKLFSYPWFGRLWVWQEIRLANSRATVVCGTYAIPWITFRKAAFWLYYKSPELLYKRLNHGHTLLNRISNVIKASDTSSTYDLGELTRVTKDCECSDPRDRVYAVMNLVTRPERGLRIEADYTKTVCEVYQQAAIEWLKSSHTLGLLFYCRLKDHGESTPTQIKSPSWVPDWSSKILGSDMSVGKASGRSSAVWSYRGSGVLEVTGICVATVELVEEITSTSMIDIVSAIKLLGELLHREEGNGVRLQDYSKLDTICRIICCNDFADLAVPPLGDTPAFADARRLVSSILGFVDQAANFKYGAKDFDLIIRTVDSYWPGRVLFRSWEGHVGMAPQAARPGDIVTVLLGANFPVILRPNRRGQHQTIGACYFEGFMEGKALLGPYPGNYRAVYWLDRAVGHYILAYVNNDTGGLRYSDPRIRSMSSNDDHPAQDEAWKSDIRAFENSQLTPEALRKRGVDTEVFELI